MTQSPLGVSLTLSAFCPTAASLLFDDGPFASTTIDDSARRYEGMDARDVMPPLLREDMLMDWDAVERWEQLAVSTLSDHRDEPDTALDIIETASAEVCATWTPREGSLSGTLTERFARVSEHRARSSRRRGAGEPQSGLGCDLLAAPQKTRPTLAPAIARFLAGHAFACWPMYDGRGIAGAVGHLREVRATLDEESARLAGEAGRALDPDLLKEAFRQADLRLRHTVSGIPARQVSTDHSLDA